MAPAATYPRIIALLKARRDNEAAALLRLKDKLDSKKSVLTTALNCGCLNTVLLCIEKFNINVAEPLGYSSAWHGVEVGPIHYACNVPDNDKLLLELLQRGAKFIDSDIEAATVAGNLQAVVYMLNKREPLGIIVNLGVKAFFPRETVESFETGIIPEHHLWVRLDNRLYADESMEAFAARNGRIIKCTIGPRHDCVARKCLLD